MTDHLLSHPDAFDLDAYLARIGYDGPRRATLDVLSELHVRHAQAIAFENVNPLLGWPVRLDTASLVQKLVHERRGGYCFEQNLLFAHALQAVGFRFGGLAARVVYGQPTGALTPRGHMLLWIEIDDATWIADVGFGGLTPTAPLTLIPGVEQATPHEPFRLATSGPHYFLEARMRDAWIPLYRFSLDAAYLVDYEMASWYLCHFPTSPFVSGLIAARPAPDRRYALRDNVLTIHHRDGRTERQVLATAREIFNVMEGPLGLHLPEAPELDAAFERVCGAAGSPLAESAAAATG